MIYNINYLKIVLTLLMKTIILYIQVFEINVKIFGFEKLIIRYNTCFKLIIFLVLDK